MCTNVVVLDIERREVIATSYAADHDQLAIDGDHCMVVAAGSHGIGRAPV